MVLVCFPTTPNNMLHFIQSDSTVSFNFILALRRYSKSFTHPHLHWLHTATLHEICCPAPSSRSEVVLFLFICCAYAWDFFLTIFLEGFADVISTDFLCFALRVFAVLPHPLSSPHAFGTNGIQHLDCPFKVTRFEDGLCSLSSTLNLSPGALRPFQPFWPSHFITGARHLRLRNLSGESCGPCANLHAKHLCML